MSPEKRSALMARIRGRDTGPEKAIAIALMQRGLAFETHATDLPGRPDIVLRAARIAVFVDGDFWHGWQFSRWRHKLSEHWENKIETNMRRDARNFRKLRASGWIVVRVWEHQITTDLPACIARIVAAKRRRRKAD
jgi:DNA mismatch endonuclease (patch repair protein)